MRKASNAGKLRARCRAQHRVRYVAQYRVRYGHDTVCGTWRSIVCGTVTTPRAVRARYRIRYGRDIVHGTGPVSCTARVRYRYHSTVSRAHSPYDVRNARPIRPPRPHCGRLASPGIPPDGFGPALSSSLLCALFARVEIDFHFQYSNFHRERLNGQG